MQLLVLGRNRVNQIKVNEIYIERICVNQGIGVLQYFCTSVAYSVPWRCEIPELRCH
jgi:hypothetical protein